MPGGGGSGHGVEGLSAPSAERKPAQQEDGGQLVWPGPGPGQGLLQRAKQRVLVGAGTLATSC